MVDTQAVQAAKEHFGVVLEEQLERVERLKQTESPIDFSAIKPVIGILGGDGIGPFIAAESQRLLEHLMQLNFLGEEYARGVPHYLYQN